VATLTRSELPAGLDEVVGLSFTERGQELFGFGETYTGTFNELRHGQLVCDGFTDLDGQEISGFRGNGESLLSVLLDLDPPTSSLPSVRETEYFWVTGHHAIRPSGDRLSLDFVDVVGISQSLDVVGARNLVPEPSFGWLHLVVARLTLLTCRRRRV